MNKEFAPYDISLEIKKLGFNEPCFGYYVSGELRGVNLGLDELGGVEPYYKRFGFHTICNSDINNMEKSVVTSPTFSQAFRWFRNVHGLNGMVEGCKKYGFEWCIFPDIDHYIKPPNNFDNYEDCEIACLRRLIEIVKERL